LAKLAWGRAVLGIVGVAFFLPTFTPTPLCDTPPMYFPGLDPFGIAPQCAASEAGGICGPCAS
jgi:hypothetical protein